MTLAEQRRRIHLATVAVGHTFTNTLTMDLSISKRYLEKISAINEIDPYASDFQMYHRMQMTFPNATYCV